jgi:2-C-methyl-D-erythritol 4-phosphate cytidylyltransferase 2
MIAAVVLGAGKGTRMASSTLPKQFLNLGGSPMIVQTVEKFAAIEEVSKIVVVVSKPWMTHARDLFRGKPYIEKLIFCEGGCTRQESLLNACNYLKNEFGKEIGVISHDAARPFLSIRIIEDNIKHLRKGNACDTVLPCTDTIVESRDSEVVSNIPNRNYLYQGQTPQSFICQEYIDAYEKIGEDPSVTDAAKLLLKYGKPVLLVRGEPFNIKITTDFDLAFADFLMSSKQ